MGDFTIPATLSAIESASAGIPDFFHPAAAGLNELHRKGLRVN
jgi:hypothetical protein